MRVIRSEFTQVMTPVSISATKNSVGIGGAPRQSPLAGCQRQNQQDESELSHRRNNRLAMPRRIITMPMDGITKAMSRPCKTLFRVIRPQQGSVGRGSRLGRTSDGSLELGFGLIAIIFIHCFSASASSSSDPESSTFGGYRSVVTARVLDQR